MQQAAPCILKDTDQLGEAGGDELWLELCPLLVAQTRGQGVLQTQLLDTGEWIRYLMKGGIISYLEVAVSS